jgi:hypothetical protein
MVLGPIFFVILVLLAGRLQVDFKFDGSELEIYFQYLFFRKKITSGNGKEETETGKEGEGKEKEGGSGSGKIIEGIRSAPDFIRPIKKFFQTFTRYGEIPELKVEGKLGTGDPYYTGIAYGVFQTIGGLVRSFVPQFRLLLDPDFSRENYDLAAEGAGRIRLGGLLYAFIVTLFYLPKRQTWRLIRGK